MSAQGGGGRRGGPQSRAWRQLFRKQFHKTKMCRFFPTGECRYGEDCPYAHANTEIEHAPDLTKTALCVDFENGFCPRGSDECPFAHGAAELRTTEAFSASPMCSKRVNGGRADGEDRPEDEDEDDDETTSAASPPARAGPPGQLQVPDRAQQPPQQQRQQRQQQPQQGWPQQQQHKQQQSQQQQQQAPLNQMLQDQMQRLQPQAATVLFLNGSVQPPQPQLQLQQHQQLSPNATMLFLDGSPMHLPPQQQLHQDMAVGQQQLQQEQMRSGLPQLPPDLHPWNDTILFPDTDKAQPDPQQLQPQEGQERLQPPLLLPIPAHRQQSQPLLLPPHMALQMAAAATPQARQPQLQPQMQLQPQPQQQPRQQLQAQLGTWRQPGMAQATVLSPMQMQQQLQQQQQIQMQQQAVMLFDDRSPMAAPQWPAAPGAPPGFFSQPTSMAAPMVAAPMAAAMAAPVPAVPDQREVTLLTDQREVLLLPDPREAALAAGTLLRGGGGSRSMSMLVPQVPPQQHPQAPPQAQAQQPQQQEQAPPPPPWQERQQEASRAARRFSRSSADGGNSRSAVLLPVPENRPQKAPGTFFTANKISGQSWADVDDKDLGSFIQPASLSMSAPGKEDDYVAVGSVQAQPFKSAFGKKESSLSARRGVSLEGISPGASTATPGSKSSLQSVGWPGSMPAATLEEDDEMKSPTRMVVRGRNEPARLCGLDGLPIGSRCSSPCRNDAYGEIGSPLNAVLPEDFEGRFASPQRDYGRTPTSSWCWSPGMSPQRPPMKMWSRTPSPRRSPSPRVKARMYPPAAFEGMYNHLADIFGHQGLPEVGPMPSLNDDAGPMPSLNDNAGPMPSLNDNAGPMLSLNDNVLAGVFASRTMPSLNDNVQEGALAPPPGAMAGGCSGCLALGAQQPAFLHRAPSF